MQDSQTAISGQPSAVCCPAHSLRPSRLRRSRSGFTLTELLIVIAIIAVLAGLIAAAALNAIKRGRETRIQLEIQNMASAIENFKNDYGAYPPNGMTEAPGTTTPGSSAQLVRSDFNRMFKKAFPQHQEPAALIAALAGVNPGSAPVSGPLQNGMRANEAVYFWLAGFSSDEKYPISGPGGPSFIDGAGNEVLEDRNKRYEFDLGRLGPRTEDGVFDESKGRFITYDVNIGGTVQSRRINFWQYTPSGSEQPFVYFDVSRHKPGNGSGKYDVWAADPASFPYIYAMKQLREGVPAVAGNINNVAFVNQGKFQLLHSGIDDDWGSDGFKQAGILSVPGSNPDNLLLFPDGPFIGPMADNLANFSEGSFESASE